MQVDQYPSNCENIWRLSDRLVLITGWSAERGKEFELRILRGDKEEVLAVESPRLLRPDVGEALGGLSEEPCEFGFFKVIELSVDEEPPDQIEIGTCLFPWQECDHRDDDFASLGCDLVDLCHWNFTPPQLIPQLLSADLGKALIERMRMQHASWRQRVDGWHVAKESFALKSPQLRIVWETCDDPAEQQLQFLRLARGFIAHDVQLLVLEHQLHLLEFQHLGALPKLAGLQWMFPFSCEVLPIPPGLTTAQLEADLQGLAKAKRTVWVGPDEGFSLDGRSTFVLPKRSRGPTLATSASWQRAVDAWLQQNSCGCRRDD